MNNNNDEYFKNITPQQEDSEENFVDWTKDTIIQQGTVFFASRLLDRDVHFNVKDHAPFILPK